MLLVLLLLFWVLGVELWFSGFELLFSSSVSCTRFHEDGKGSKVADFCMHFGSLRLSFVCLLAIEGET